MILGRRLHLLARERARKPRGATVEKPSDHLASGDAWARVYLMRDGTVVAEGLITEAEAEAILARLEASAGARERTRIRGADYLLSGLLVTPAGQPWHGDRGSYRTPGGAVNAAELEAAVLEQLAADFSAPSVVGAFAREIRALQEKMADAAELTAARGALEDVERRIRRMMALVEESEEPGPLVRRLDELERERRSAGERVARAEDALADARVVQAVTEEDVRQLLAGMAGSLAEMPREALKEALRGWLSRVELDPASRAGRITYRLDLSRDKVASPRRPGAIPVIAAAGPTFTIRRLRRARAPLRL